MAFTGYSNSGSTYDIGSEKGMNFITDAPSGSKLTGGDGSSWTKNSDGSTTISKNGTTYNVGSAIGSLQNSLDSITKTSASTSARNLEYAQQQQEWSANQAAIANQFNAAEAAKNRDWQAYMSNTAHQREVADLKAAGLNPVLSAMNGNGASVTSGSAASANLPSGESAKASDATNAFVSLLGSMLSAQTSLTNTAVSAKSNEAIADKYNAMSGFIAEMQDATNRWSAQLSSDTSKENSKRSAAVSKYAAEIQAAASRFGAQLSFDAATSIAAAQLEWNTEHPNNGWQVIGDVLYELFGDSPGGSAKTFWDKLKDLYSGSGSHATGSSRSGSFGSNSNPGYWHPSWKK